VVPELHLQVHGTSGYTRENTPSPNSAKLEQPNAVIYSVKLHKCCSVPTSVPLPRPSATSHGADCEIQGSFSNRIGQGDPKLTFF